MIIRIFTARIYPDHLEEFRVKFKEVSVPATKGADGLLSLEIGGPIGGDLDEFLMISRWDSEASIKKFAGEDWNKAFIPKGMEGFISECSVKHFENIDL